MNELTLLKEASSKLSLKPLLKKRTHLGRLSWNELTITANDHQSAHFQERWPHVAAQQHRLPAVHWGTVWVVVAGLSSTNSRNPGMPFNSITVVISAKLHSFRAAETVSLQELIKQAGSHKVINTLIWFKAYCVLQRCLTRLILLVVKLIFFPWWGDLVVDHWPVFKDLNQRQFRGICGYDVIYGHIVSVFQKESLCWRHMKTPPRGRWL